MAQPAQDRPGGLARRAQLSDEVAVYVREAVMSGQLRPGEFIRLDAVADRLGTSVTPVREALMQLRGQDIVKLLPRRGYVVAPLSRVDVEDLFDVQAHLSGELAERAARAIDPARIASLVAINRRLGRAVRANSPAEIEQAEIDFHRGVNAAAHSRKLAFLLGNASNYLPQHFYSADAQWRSAANRDHTEILAALRAADGKAARAAMQAHVLAGKHRLLAHLDAIGFWSDVAGA